MNIIDLVRDIPGLAPKAAQFNRLCKNLDDLYLSTTFRGALIKKTSDQTINPGNINTEIIFATTTYDTSSCWAGGNPNRLTVPSTVTRVRLSANIVLATAQSFQTTLEFYKNGAFIPSTTLRPYQQDGASGCPISNMNIQSPILTVVAGDYFTLRVTVGNSGTSWVCSNTNSTWFAMEIVK